MIAPSFNAIFKRNRLRNLLLPALANAEGIAATQAAVTVDLAARMIRAETGESWTFHIKDKGAEMLLSVRDEIDFTLHQGAAIDGWRTAERQRGWAYVAGAMT